MIYTCPMHPEIQQTKPGHCPKCGMQLIVKSKMQTLYPELAQQKTTWKSYMPLVVIFGILLFVTLTFTYKDFIANSLLISKSISYFMIGFFLTFSGFKLMDIEGFAQGYFTYDLLAKRWFGYGYIYPFIELFFAIAMILLPHVKLILWLEIFVMAFSGLGVAIKLTKHEKFQCACLGTFLKVPLTKITLIEDFGMAILALTMLLLH